MAVFLVSYWFWCFKLRHRNPMLIRVNKRGRSPLIGNNRLNRSCLRRFNHLIKTALVLHAGLQGKLALKIGFHVECLELQHVTFFLFTATLGCIQLKLTTYSQYQQQGSH